MSKICLLLIANLGNSYTKKKQLIENRLIPDLNSGVKIVNELKESATQIAVIEKMGDIDILLKNTISNLVELIKDGVPIPFGIALLKKRIQALSSLCFSSEIRVEVYPDCYDIPIKLLDELYRIVKKFFTLVYVQKSPDIFNVELFGNPLSYELVIQHSGLGYLFSYEKLPVELAGIQEEVNHLKATVIFDSIVDKGSTIFITIPK